MIRSGKTVLMVSPSSPLEGGSDEAYVANLAGPLARAHGWRIVVVTTGSHLSGVRREEGDGIVVHRLPSQLQLADTRFGLTWRRHLARLARDERPDLINAHPSVFGLTDLVAAVAGDVPLVVTCHAGSTGLGTGRWASDAVAFVHRRVLSQRLLRRAEWIISGSGFVRDFHLTRFRTKCSVVTPAVDTARFERAAPRPPDRLLFVAGRGCVETFKGLDALLDGLAILRRHRPHLSLDVVGDGNDVERYRSRSSRLGIGSAVRFRGRLAGPSLVRAFRDATVLAQPTQDDPFPLALLEAMASSLPVVSTVVGGAPSPVRDGVEGFLVPPDDPGALVDRLAAVLNDTELGDRLGRAGRAKVERSYTWAATAAATDSVFDAVLAGAPVGGRRRISVVAPHFPPKVGGLEQYAYQIARGLQESGNYEVQVLTSNHVRRRASAEVLDGLTVLRYPTWMRASNTPMSPTWPYHLRRSISDNRIELVNAHTPVPFMAEAAALGCGDRPLAVTYHAGSMVKHRQPADAFVRVYERLVLPRLLRRADAVIAVSEMVRSRFLHGRWHPVDLAPPAVDPDLFRPAAAPTSPTLLFVGRIERSSAWKGIDVLLRAFVTVAREVPDAQLVLVGGGDAVADHRRDAARLGLEGRVTFTGELTGERLAAAYGSATAVVLPSTTEAESFGMCLIEGMACAKPVIGSNVGGIPFVITDGEDGLLVPPGDADALAACCARLLTDPTLAASLGANGRCKVVADYTWQSRVAQYDRLFRELLDRACPTADASRCS